MADVAPVVHPVKVNQRQRLIGAGQGFFQRGRGGRYPQRAASGGEQLAARTRSSRMKDHYAGDLRGRAQE